jgi:RNA polymerase sigma factor (sigma-70 family)
LCYHYLQQTEDAEEVTQDVFVSVFKNMESFLKASSMDTWIYRIAVNKCIDFLRQRERRKRWIIWQWLNSATSDVMGGLRNDKHPGVLLEQKEAEQKIFERLNQLSDKHRMVILLLKVEGLSQKQAAEVMEISEKAVESMFQRAKQQLSEKLKIS